MKIVVVGTGYVGLVTGTCFAETGNIVTCVDIDTQKVEKLKNGELTIFEPGLEHLFRRNVKDGRLHFTTHLEEDFDDAEVVFLALPTPSDEDGSADLQYVLQVAGHIGKILKDYKVIVNKSTVPVGTSEKVAAAIQSNYQGAFDVVSNPEFLREGVAVDDFMKPDRIVVGTTSERARAVLQELYEPFINEDNMLLFMDARSAELTKYAANTFLAMKVTFMNEIANLCEKVNADVDMIRKGIGADDRIGKKFLYAGIGYGGSCFPKDVKALAKSASEADYNFKILNAVLEVNEKQKLSLLPKIKSYFNKNLKGKTIAVWGLAFKPDTDDIREAPSLTIIDTLLSEGAAVKVFDPEAMENIVKKYDARLLYGQDQYECLENADALIIVTEWDEFRFPDFEKMSKLLKDKVIFDGRNLYEIKEMKKFGFHYESVGRQVVKRI
ncbi:MAG: UDP-glucose/GDP-mannose dehydrogenase family protein [Sphingobacteriales bacterium]|jgi:UDPglucose 6-dehydrogenase|nr:UDP-glucose/GDP-mannose dehydrogenase family protein [Sphingobacteriales bacterium]